MYRRFVFEGEVHEALDCVPLAVRRKLDLAGLKISLAGWQALSHAERLALCNLPVDTSEDLGIYVEVLQGFAARAGVPLSPLPEAPVDRITWSPGGVRARLQARLEGHAVPDEEALGRLTDEERYSLFKLADPRREPAKLLLLLRELGIARGDEPHP
jgi:hypothetical protein